MYKSYLAAAKANDILNKTDTAFLLEFFGSLAGPTAMDPADANDQYHQLLNLVGSYHTALLNGEQRIPPRGANDVIDPHDLSAYETRVFEYILIDLAYRIYRGNNPLILKIMVDWMFMSGDYTTAGNYDEFFLWLYTELKLTSLSQWQLSQQIRDALTGSELIKGTKSTELMLFNRNMETKVKTVLDAIDAMEIDVGDYNEHAALCLLKYRINMLIYCPTTN